MRSSLHPRNGGLVLPLIAVHLAIAVPLAYWLNIWSDEGSSLYATQNGLLTAFHNVASEQRQAPLYYWILSLWRSLNGSIFFARFLSIIFSACAIWLLWRLALDVLKSRRAALLAAAFFALHPITIWASCEIRIYALVILLSVALLQSFFNAFFDGPTELAMRQKILFVLIAVIALYTNYYLGFMLVGLFAALVVTRKWGAAIHYLAAMALAAFAASPLGLILGQQLNVGTADIVEQPTLFASTRHIWNHVLTFILPADIPARDQGATSVGTVRLWIVRILLTATAVVGIVRWRRVSAITVGLGAISATIFAGLVIACLFVGGWLVELRHASVLFAPLTLFLASLIKDVFGSDKDTGAFKYVATLAGVAVIWFFWYALSGMYPNLSKNGDWRRVGAYIEQHEKPDQPVIVFHTYDTLVMPYEYHGVNRVFPDERFFEFDFGPLTPDRMKERTEFTISKIPADASEIWVITNDECRRPGVCEQFERFLNENFLVVQQRAFYRNNVTLLRRRMLPMIVSE